MFQLFIKVAFPECWGYCLWGEGISASTSGPAAQMCTSFFSICWVTELSQEEVPKGQTGLPLPCGRSWGQEARGYLTGMSDAGQQG